MILVLGRVVVHGSLVVVVIVVVIVAVLLVVGRAVVATSMVVLRVPFGVPATAGVVFVLIVTRHAALTVTTLLLLIYWIQ